MRIFIVYVSIIIFLQVAGCGYMNKIKQTGEEVTEELDINNPLTEAQKKEALIETRKKVRETKVILHNCLDKNKGNSSACEKEKEAHDKSVERYIELQKM